MLPHFGANRGRVCVGLFQDFAASFAASMWVLGAADGEATRVMVAESSDGESSAAADRYAQAAFELALEANALDALSADFGKLAEAFAESADLRTTAASPLIDPQEKARAFVAVADKLGVSPLGRNVIGVIVRNRRANELTAVGRVYANLVAKHRGARRAEIISAKKLTDAEAQSIADALAKSLDAKVEVETKVDESLIGGFVVRVGSRQFDASLKSKLASLKLALKSA